MMPQTQFPDTDTLRTALMLATRAPSVHNSQPWLWRIGEESLHLFANPDLHLPRTDPDRRDLMISCGAALHHCTTALTALGWQSIVHRMPNRANPAHLAAIELTPCTPTDTDIALAAAIPRRRTDRRTFGRWPVSPADIALMGARAARMGVSLRRIDGTIKLKEIVDQSVAAHAQDWDYLHELAMWSGRHASAAGVPARNCPPPQAAAPLPGRFFASAELAQPARLRPAEDRAAIVVLGTRDDDELARLRAGEATSAVLLTCTATGLATCPVTEPLEVAATRERIGEEVYGSTAHAQMMLRIGWAPVTADPLPATPRRAYEDVVAPLDGAAL